MRLRSVHLENFRAFESAQFVCPDLTIAVGLNNAGKSSLLHALRLFFGSGAGSGSVKWDRERDRRHGASSDAECFVECAFELDAEEAAALPEKYLLPPDPTTALSGGRLRVRWVPEGDNAGYHGYVQGDEREDLDSTEFFGAKNVARGKLGRVIYVPAVHKLEEAVKTSGTSPFRDLLQASLKDVLKDTQEEILSAYTRILSAIEDAEEDSQVKRLSSRVSELLGPWEAEFAVTVKAPESDDIIKQSLEPVLRMDGRAHAPSTVGDGLQRSLVVALIRARAEVARSSKATGGAAGFEGNLELLLFEEPESFLHPTHVQAVSSALRDLAATDGHQVLLTTHSPTFIAGSARELPSIVRVSVSETGRTVGQVDATQVDAFAAMDLPNDPSDADWVGETVPMWLNSSRAAALLASRVLLVEGATEIAVFDFLRYANGNFKFLDGCDVAVVETLGKHGMARFMRVLSELDVPYAVMCDTDDLANAWHQAAHDAIEAASTDCPRFLGKCQWPTDFEGFLNISTPTKNKFKPASAVTQVRQMDTDAEELLGLATEVRKALQLQV